MKAAGLAFYFLLGLIPFMFITTAVTGYLFARRPDVLATVSTTLLAFLPPGIGEKTLVQIHTAVDGWETFGVLGVVALFFVSMGLFEALDWSVNGAMGTRRKVGYVKGRLLVFAYITGAIVFFTLASVADYFIHIMLATPQLAEFTEIVHIPRRAFSMLAFAVFLFIVYIAIPARPPRVIRAAVAAISVAAVWAILQKLGAIITVYISRRHAVYGALAGGALFLTWMYLLANLILIGATALSAWRGRTKVPAINLAQPLHIDKEESDEEEPGEFDQD